MRIFVLVNDGSPRLVTMKSMWGDGVNIGIGGAELGLLTMCEAWHNAGHEVVLFNDPRELNASPFEQRTIGAFNPNEPCDALIVFRSPNLRIIGSKAKQKLWWSTDQFTIGDFRAFRPMVDKVICISEYHKKYFEEKYGINDAIVIDLPVRVQDYQDKNIVKIRNRFVFTSVPARGLDIMLDIWPKIRKEIPDATLVITSDYRLWGSHLGQGNEQFIAKAMRLEGIIFLSAIPREKLIEEQLKAEVNVYPCIYDELFCIAIAESQVAGAYPITSDCGALATTNMGTIIPGDPNRNKSIFVEQAVLFANKLREDGYDLDLQQKATERFHPDKILAEWNEKVFNV
jgi:glycosyltransferase involved in cell wall biosynthesis